MTNHAGDRPGINAGNDDRCGRSRPRLAAATGCGQAALARPADPAAAAAFDDVSGIIEVQYAAGVSPEQIAAHHADVAAALLADARTPPGRAYARQYAETARSLIAGLARHPRPEDSR